MIDNEKIAQYIKKLPLDHDKALEMVRKESGLKEGFLLSEIPHDSEYWNWMNAFRHKFNKSNPPG